MRGELIKDLVLCEGLLAVDITSVGYKHSANIQNDIALSHKAS